MALGIGVSWGTGMLLLGWITAFGWGTEMLNVLSSLYIGFMPGFFGGIVGALWGFIDGAIGGIIIALVYNATAGKKLISGIGFAKNVSINPGSKGKTDI
jgi:hypothetical protein